MVDKIGCRSVGICVGGNAIDLGRVDRSTQNYGGKINWMSIGWIYGDAIYFGGGGGVYPNHWDC